jgi:hypothetical protein
MYFVSLGYVNTTNMKSQKIIVYRKVGQQLASAEIYFETNGYFHFFNAQHLYFKLSNYERAYFDYMCEKMDFSNRVNLNAEFRKKFEDHINRITSSNKAPSERTLQRYEVKLLFLKLLISNKKMAAAVFVNPKYVMNGTLSERKKLLEKLADMALEGDIDLSTIIDRPIDSIQPNNVETA